MEGLFALVIIVASMVGLAVFFLRGFDKVANRSQQVQADKIGAAVTPLTQSACRAGRGIAK